MRRGNGLALGNEHSISIRILPLAQTQSMFGFFEKFLIAGANLNITIHSEPWISYCLDKLHLHVFGRTESFDAFLLRKADIDTADSNGNSPLQLVLSRSFPSEKVVRSLIARAANVNKTNAAGASPLKVCLLR
jgi:hypothetical protein